MDFDDPDRTRTAKSSVKFYTDLVKANGFPSNGGGLVLLSSSGLSSFVLPVLLTISALNH